MRGWWLSGRDGRGRLEKKRGLRFSPFPARMDEKGDSRIGLNVMGSVAKVWYFKCRVGCAIYLTFSVLKVPVNAAHLCYGQGPSTADIQRSVFSPFAIHNASLSVPKRWGFLHDVSRISRTSRVPLLHGFSPMPGDYSLCTA